MFARKLSVVVMTAAAEPDSAAGTPVPLAWLDSFAMRNFTNDAAFDDTLPVANGLLEAGFRVPVDGLARALEAWCRKKGWMPTDARIEIREQ